MPRTVKGIARKALAADKKERKAVYQAADKERKAYQQSVGDSYQNFAAAIGIQTSNISSAGQYGFDPLTRIRTQLEWIHRGSWLGGVAIDVVADDMTRAGVQIKGEMVPEDIAKIEELAVSLGIWKAINDTIKWGRLYGGAIGVLLIQGQDTSTPLRIETVGKGQFRGILPLDRWMVEPSLEDLVQDFGPFLGLPKYYRVTTDAPALNLKKIHYTRCFRMEGIRVPYWQRLMENLWSVSVLERLKDRMQSYDSATLGASQLVFKAHIRSYKIKGLRALVAAGGKGFAALVRQVQFMRTTQTNEGITMLDMDDDFASDTAGSSAISGIQAILEQLGEQLSGALQIPQVRLFGQSPGGLNSSGDGELRTYYDGINQQQNGNLKSPVTLVYRAMAQSLGLDVPPGFGIAFRPLWQLTEEQKSASASATTESVTKAKDAGLISDQVAMKELKQSSDMTGVFSNITREDIEAADDVPAPKIDTLMPGEGDDEGGGGPAAKKKAKDQAAAALELECALVEGR